MDKNKNVYYLGLDLGTNSVGWAVTDPEYKLLRAKGQDLWGIREFDTAQTASARRVNRISRRRRQREIARIGLLNEMFAAEIEKVDSCFFARLQNSKYYLEDKEEIVKTKNGIFADKDFSDTEYYKKYPTIFHLRKDLLNNREAQYDIRLVYLAILNMFKHRGHFLLNGVDGEDAATDMTAIFAEISQKLVDDYEIQWRSVQVDLVIDILGAKDKSRKTKLEELADLLGVRKSEKESWEILKCFCGLVADARMMFGIDKDEKLLINFGSYSYAEEIANLQESLGTSYELVELMKQVYDHASLAGILRGYNFLSEARVESYDKHKSDLVILKRVYKKYFTEEDYNEMFRSSQKGSYSAYVNSLNSVDALTIEKKYRRNMGDKSARTVEALYDRIKKKISGFENDEDVQYILNEMETEQFLPKQLTGANGVIPNQVHKKELAKILQNAEGYLPFLKEKNESGLSVSQRILKLFSFQIPYYIGPLGEHSKNYWAVRKETGAILPWNLSEKIDISATSEQFINRLIRTCTFLAGEKVMPKESLAYEKYCVLNEINNLCIDGERIDTDLKQQIYRELFQKYGNVTRKKLNNFLLANGIIESAEQITGIDDNINNSLSSYKKMYSVFGEKLKEDSYKKMAEDIIYLGTVFADSRDIYKEKLVTYLQGGAITESEYKRLAGYRFKDWGRYSKALLELTGIDKNTGEVISILQAMWEYSLNFQELINSEQFTFKEEMEAKTIKAVRTLAEFEAEDLDEYYFSAPVKRMIWQTILIIREIEQVMGGTPEKIFIEMTRTDEEKGDKGRKNSRAKQLIDCYKNIKNHEISSWINDINNADSEGKLRSKKLYLYYLQMGKDVYTGEPIDLDRLFDNNLYDIDHIYPRHYVKDDSILNNLVLVNKRANEELKKDFYPVPKAIRENPKVTELWDVLHKMQLMNDEKYSRLKGNNPFTEQQMAGFISRQLVETSQGTKGVADLLKQLLPDTAIVYSKATNVSDFRRDNGFYKSRIVNEFHHANDAYLNIVVGNVYYTKFTQNPYNFITKEYANDKENNHYHLDKMFAWDVKRNGYTAWKAEKRDKSGKVVAEGSISVVRKMLSKNTPILSRMNYEGKGAMYNIQPLGKYKAKAENYMPLKNKSKVFMDVTKYGGYTSWKPAYFIFIEHGKPEKRRKCFEVVPIIWSSKIQSREDLIKYCTDSLGYINVDIICDKIKKNSLIKLDGYFLYITSIDSSNRVDFHNATNLCVSKEYYKYIHKIEKYVKEGCLDKEISADGNMQIYTLLLEKHTGSIFKNNPRPLGKVLVDGKSIFEKMDIEKQLHILYGLLQVSAVGNVEVNLSEIGGAKDSGRIRISSNMTNRRELLLINHSVTGLFVNNKDLLKG